MWETLVNPIYDLIVKAAAGRGEGVLGGGKGIKRGYFQSARSVR